MTLRVNEKGFVFCASVLRRTVWTYQTNEHILDVMTKPGYFARVAERLSVGDIILVDCPGYFQIERVLGNPPSPVKRFGGGVLQVDALGACNLVGLRIVGRGLRRFVKSGENAMSDVFEMETRAASDDTVLSA